MKSVIGGTTTAFVGTLLEWSGSSSTMKKYYYAGSERIAMRTGSSTLNYILGDHLGSASVTTDSTGNNAVYALYKPWGESRYNSGALPTKYTYTGQYSNMSDFGLMYYNARWYDPALGRFTSADTLIPEPGNPQSWDRYAYVENNPLRYTDPSGHYACEDELCENRETIWEAQTHVKLSSTGLRYMADGEIYVASGETVYQAYLEFLKSGAFRKWMSQYPETDPFLIFVAIVLGREASEVQYDPGLNSSNEKIFISTASGWYALWVDFFGQEAYGKIQNERDKQFMICNWMGQLQSSRILHKLKTNPDSILSFPEWTVSFGIRAAQAVINGTGRDEKLEYLEPGAKGWPSWANQSYFGDEEILAYAIIAPKSDDPLLILSAQQSYEWMTRQ